MWWAMRLGINNRQDNMMEPTFWQVDDGCESTIVGRFEIEEMLTRGGPSYDVTRLELLASFDHGSRTADELAMCVIDELASLVVVPLCAFMSMCGTTWHDADAWSAALQELNASAWDGRGWSDNYYDGCEGISRSLYELSDAVEGYASDAGYIVDTSGDAGMTWIYRVAS